MSKSELKTRKILIGVSGSIAAYKCCTLVSALVKDEFDVQVVTTKSAKNFVGNSTFEGLTGKRVFDDVYEPGRQMDHIHLVRESDLFIIYPATANTINRLASGLAEDSIGALALANAYNIPLWVAPAMNSQMLLHPATQDSLDRLKKWGTELLFGNEGALACGEFGIGRLIEPEEVLLRINSFYEGKQL
ncbi:MAG: phosphopantothenoylcysteine decarboxylase [Bdellovibrionales bacterium]|nr:phosphopantothenoylcysteine decarboxylase [Bdellovibrionales bacterium]